MTMWSGGSGRSKSASMVGTKSSATVQQMQPLASSSTSSSWQPSTPQLLRISPSTPRSPNSLMISARRLPFAVSSRCRIVAVLPAPRKPVITVVGMRLCSIAPILYVFFGCFMCSGWPATMKTTAWASRAIF